MTTKDQVQSALTTAFEAEFTLLFRNLCDAVGVANKDKAAEKVAFERFFLGYNIAIETRDNVEVQMVPKLGGLRS